MVNFRKYVASSGLEILGGRDAENNDKLVWNAKSNDVLLHTDAPGSPFVNVGETPSKTDLKEAAVFCARYSRDWRDNKKDVVVHKFLRRDMNKSSKMKAGSWNVKKLEKIKVKKVDVSRFENAIQSR